MRCIASGWLAEGGGAESRSERRAGQRKKKEQHHKFVRFFSPNSKCDRSGSGGVTCGRPAISAPSLLHPCLVCLRVSE
ncbi:hypothetical protein SRHO_G00162270 [Serrasalmus rhombeus]